MKRALLSCLCLPIWLGCSKPCTVCPNVAGYYNAWEEANDVGNSSCDFIYNTGGNYLISVTQSGSRVEMVRFLDALPGTLYDDNTLQIDEFDGVAVYPDGSQPDIPLKEFISGVFSGAPGTYKLDGLRQFTAPSNGCVARIHTIWTQQQVTP